jgi:hypothetical protein
VAWVLDLGEACVECGLQQGGWIVGAQLKPGAAPGMLIVRRIVGELDAEVPAAGKSDDEHGLVDTRILNRPYRAAPEGGLKALGQFLAPVWARENVDVATESDHDLVGPFLPISGQPADKYPAVASSQDPHPNILSMPLSVRLG